MGFNSGFKGLIQSGQIYHVLCIAGDSLTTHNYSGVADYGLNYSGREDNSAFE